jgi:hypothetical protein
MTDHDPRDAEERPRVRDLPNLADRPTPPELFQRGTRYTQAWWARNDAEMLRALPFEDLCRQAVEAGCGIVLCDETDLARLEPTFPPRHISRYGTVDDMNDPVLGITAPRAGKRA